MPSDGVLDERHEQLAVLVVQALAVSGSGNRPSTSALVTVVEAEPRGGRDGRRRDRTPAALCVLDLEVFAGPHPKRPGVRRADRASNLGLPSRSITAPVDWTAIDVRVHPSQPGRRQR